MNKDVPAGKSGSVIPLTDAAGILTGKGILEINHLQLAGKRSMDIDDFLRGQPDFITAELPD
jgi:methionyl-tRNA formyltransferase